MKPKFFILGLVTLVALALLVKHMLTPTAHVFKPIEHKFEVFVESKQLTLFSPEDLMKMIDSGENYIAERFHDLGIVRDARHHYTLKGNSYQYCQKIITSSNGDTLRYILSNRDEFNTFWQELDKKKVLPAEKQIGSNRVIECRELNGFVFKRYGFDADYDDFCIIVTRKSGVVEPVVNTNSTSNDPLSYNIIKLLLRQSVEQRTDKLIKMGFSYSKSKRDSYGTRSFYLRQTLSGGNSKYDETVIVWLNGDLEFIFSNNLLFSDLEKRLKANSMEMVRLGDPKATRIEFEEKCLFFSESNEEFMISLIDNEHSYFNHLHE